MAGKRRRKMKLVTKTINDTRVSTVEAEKHNEQSAMHNMPMELLELIISRLTLEENLRASVVCRRWLKAAMSVRVADKPPWLMSFSTSDDNLVEFYDPQMRKSYWLELPQLRGCRACYARDGWLLLYRLQTRSIFFFNPYTQELIKLPRLELSHLIIAFSAAPTTTRCIVFTVKNMGPAWVQISTWRPGESEWTSVNYPNRMLISSMRNTLVYCNGHFYFLSLTGWLGVYNTEEQSWGFRMVPQPKCEEFLLVRNWWTARYMAEHHGDLYVIYTAPSLNPVIYKLDQISEAWEEMKSFGGLTFFVSALSSHARTDLLGMSRNSVYFAKVLFYGKRCISYSLTDCRFYPRKQSFDWTEQNPFGNIWIEPPEDTSIFL